MDDTDLDNKLIKAGCTSMRDAYRYGRDEGIKEACEIFKQELSKAANSRKKRGILGKLGI